MTSWHTATGEGSDEQSIECGVNVVFERVGAKWKPTILWRLDEDDRYAASGVSGRVVRQRSITH